MVNRQRKKKLAKGHGCFLGNVEQQKEVSLLSKARRVCMSTQIALIEKVPTEIDRIMIKWELEYHYKELRSMPFVHLRSEVIDLLDTFQKVLDFVDYLTSLDSMSSVNTLFRSVQDNSNGLRPIAKDAETFSRSTCCTPEFMNFSAKAYSQKLLRRSHTQSVFQAS